MTEEFGVWADDFVAIGAVNIDFLSFLEALYLGVEVVLSVLDYDFGHGNVAFGFEAAGNGFSLTDHGQTPGESAEFFEISDFNAIFWVGVALKRLEKGVDGALVGVLVHLKELDQILFEG